MTDIQVTHVSFGGDGLEVGYIEDRDRGENIAMFRTLMVPSTLVEEELAEVLVLLQEIVDRAVNELNKVPDQIPAKPREFRA